MPALLDRLCRAALARPVATIALLFLLTALPGLGNGWLWDRDETWYASCALNMIQTGDWIVPAAGDRTFLEKPPLAYWAMAASMLLFGVGEFAARLPSVLWGLGTVLLVFWLGERAAGRAVGLVAAAVMATHVHFAVMARAALVDPPLLFFMTAGMAAWWRMQEPGDRPPNHAAWCLLGGAAIGAAVLAKGPLGLFPGMIALGYVIARRDVGFFVRAKAAPLLGVVAIVLVAAPWYWAVSQRAGAEFADEFFVEHNLSRFTNPMQGHDGPFFYYVPVVVLGLLPWTAFLATMWCAPRRCLDRFDAMIALWAAIPFVFFSLTMKTKLPHYVAFSFPGLALLVAREVVWRASAEGRMGRGAARLIGAGWWLWVVVGVAMMGGGVVAGRWIIDFAWPTAVVPGLVLAGGFLATALAWRRCADVRLAAAGAGATMAAFLLVAMLVALPLASPIQTLTRATLAAMEMAEETHGEVREGHLFTMGYYEPSLFFYTRGLMRTGRGERETREFARGLAPGDTVFLLCRRKHLAEMVWYLGDDVETEAFAFDSVRQEGDKFNIRLVRATKRPAPPAAPSPTAP